MLTASRALSVHGNFEESRSERRWRGAIGSWWVRDRSLAHGAFPAMRRALSKAEDEKATLAVSFAFQPRPPYFYEVGEVHAAGLGRGRGRRCSGLFGGGGSAPAASAGSGGRAALAFARRGSFAAAFLGAPRARPLVTGRRLAGSLQ